MMPIAIMKTTVSTTIVAMSSPRSCHRTVGIRRTPKMPRCAMRWTASATRKRLRPLHEPASSAPAASSVTANAVSTVRGWMWAWLA